MTWKDKYVSNEGTDQILKKEMETEKKDMAGQQRKTEETQTPTPEKTIEKNDPFLKKRNKLKKLKIKTRFKLDFNMIIGLLIIGALFYLIGLVYIYPNDAGVYIVALIVGMLAWMPLGMPIGAFLIDTYLRAKFLRLVTKKNYGIVHIVSKGNYISTMVKDLDQSLIQKGEAIWGISKDCVINLNKKESHKITDEHIKYYSNVPVIYLDYESMKPLSFIQDKTDISPKQIGSSLLGWAMVQKKKAIRMQKQINYMYLIIAVLIGINIYLTFMVYQILQGG